ncbi:MAG: NAD(P)/FAD-dependent oxidoreductase [Gemmatimonadota bacterium]
MQSSQPILIAGAGPSGLAAALTVAKAGRRAVVYERHPDVAGRFHGDFQGIENYSTRGDALEELRAIGVEPDFQVTPFPEAVIYDDRGRAFRYRGSAPLFYMIRRGTEPGMLDARLKAQALAAGVDIRFQQPFPAQPIRDASTPPVLATGPRGSYAIVVGYIFRTPLPDLVLGSLCDELAPKGYAYLVTHGGIGTIASCLFTDLPNHQRYLDRTVEFFRSRVEVELCDARRFGGYGMVRMERTARSPAGLLTGEAAGFQDALWGFGLRYAMVSGHLAASSILCGDPASYDQRWQRRFRGLIQSSFVNRYFYQRLGNRGYRVFLSRLSASTDARAWLHSHYAPSGWKSLFARLLARRARYRALH